MALTRSAIAWHAGSVAAGGLAVFTAMASKQVDVYAIWNAMNKIVADVTTLLAALAPIVAIFGAAYRTWNAKQVPAGALVVDVGTTSKAAVDAAHPPGTTAAVSTLNSDVTGKVVGALLIGLMLTGTLHSAVAQTRKPQVTGNIIEDIKANNAAGVTPGQGLDATWAKMKEVSLTDIQYAKSLADAIGSPRSKIRSTCYGAWITVIQQSQGATAGPNGQPLGALPDPALFSHFEQAVEVIDNLQPDSPFMVACQPAANLLKQSILQFVTSAVGGVTSLGALGVGIP